MVYLGALSMDMRFNSSTLLLKVTFQPLVLMTTIAKVEVRFESRLSNVP